MKYFATIDDQTYEIDIDHHGRVTLDGVELAADLRLVEGKQLYSLLLDNASFDVIYDPDAEGRGLYDLLVSGMRYPVKVQDERSRRLALADRSLRAPTGELHIKAPIPGLIVKVPVEPGQELAEGDTLVILEAMKMENELHAPRAGVVHEVRAGPCDQVALGQVLLTLR